MEQVKEKAVSEILDGPKKEEVVVNEPGNSEVIAVFITVPNKHIAERVGSHLVEKKLAACVNIIPGVTSIFEWEGKVEMDEELILMVKTKLLLF